MNEDLWKKVDSHLERLFVAEHTELDQIVENSHNAGLPDIQVSSAQGKFLKLLTIISGASQILEIGTLGGYSTAWLAQGLNPSGKVTSIEIDPDHAEVARKNIESVGLNERVEIVCSPAVEYLEGLINSDQVVFDLIFIDADKPSYPHYLDLCLKLSKPGTIILADNIIRQGELINTSSTDDKVIGVQQFCDILSSKSGISTSAMQTVGDKGYDGWTLSIVNHL